MIKDKILNLLKQNNFEFKYMEHEPTPTSADSARIRGTRIEQGAKAIILKSKKTGKNYMLVLSGHLKINFKAIESRLKEIYGVKEELTFENPDVIFEKYGVKIGGVPPFGELMGIETYYDQNVFSNEVIDFNCGNQTCSVEMKAEDYRKIINQDNIGEFSK